jgi:excisionase family DNA binding protein
VETVISPWMTRDAAAEYMSVSPFTIDRWVREGRLVRHRIEGIRSVRYARRELDALVVPATPENG